MKIGRIDLDELDIDRVKLALKRRADNVPHQAAWLREKEGSRIRATKGIKSGKRCVIMANGPSLAKVDMTKLKEIDTIALNRAYLSFDEWGFVPSCYVCVNDLVLEQFASDISSAGEMRFLNWRSRKLMTSSDSTYYLNVPNPLTDQFSTRLDQCAYAGGSVTFVALEVAYWLGYSEVAIVGLDHRYAEAGIPNSRAVRAGEDKSHYRPDYFPPGTKWELPDLDRFEAGYKLARIAYDEAARPVFDCTDNGGSQAFVKSTLDEFLDRSES